MSAAETIDRVRERVTLKLVWKEDLPRFEGNVPSLAQFDPRFIAWQVDVLRLIREEWDYEKDGVLEVLLSGALGSAKSILVAHIVVTHCLMYPRASAVIGRRSMTDLKDSLFLMILEHIQETLVEGEDYRYNARKITFANGSTVVCKSWADKRSSKARSTTATLVAVEELTENDEEDRKAIQAFRERLGRQKHVKEQLFIAATNPDEPDHWAYKDFIVPAMKNPKGNKRVFYSVTTDNVFLPDVYSRTLLKDMDPRMAQRMIYGKWISLRGEGVYYQYHELRHEMTVDYKVDEMQPIVVSWDFNIGVGKPLSCTFSQMDVHGVKHFFDEVVIEGARTENALEDAWNRGLFDTPTIYFIRGDAAGKHGDTRNNRSDYEIIRSWLGNRVRKDGSRVMFQQEVPLANPPLRQRHNVANAWLLNDLGEIRVKVYPKAKVLREGFKLNKLKKGADYIEDDSKYYQHVTTAATYDIHYENNKSRRGRSTVTDA